MFKKVGFYWIQVKLSQLTQKRFKPCKKTIKKALPLVSGQVGANFMQGGRFYPRGKIPTLKYPTMPCPPPLIETIHKKIS